MLIDPLKSHKTAGVICEICKQTEDALLNKGPLIPMAYDNQGFFMCRSCIKTYVLKNTQVDQFGSIMTWKVDNLAAPGSRFEFPRNFIIEGKTLDLISIPKINTTIYMILERTNYDRPFGHVEGLVLKLGEKNTTTFGSSQQADVKINDPTVKPIQCTVSFLQNCFYLSDGNTPSGTLVRPYNNLQVDDLYSKQSIKMHDLVFNITWRKNLQPTAGEFVQIEHQFQAPIYTSKENHVPESILQDSRLSVSPIGGDRPDMYDFRQKVKQIPKFQTKLGIIQSEAYTPDSNQNITLNSNKNLQNGKDEMTFR